MSCTIATLGIGFVVGADWIVGADGNASHVQHEKLLVLAKT